MPTYEVVVIGGGGAGSWIAENVARGGRSTALVEERLLGGSCPYFACMPSKAMLHAAEVRHLAANAHRYGAVARPLKLGDPAAAYHAAAAWRNRVAEHHDDRGAVDRLRASGAAFYRGRATVVREGVVSVGDVELGYTDLVIATGTRFFTPPIEGLATVDVWSSDDFYLSGQLPASLVVLGGGPIGCEVAQVAARFGARVTLVELQAHLMPAEEPEIAEELQHALATEGVVIRTGTAAKSVAPAERGVAVTLSDGSTVAAERLVVAAGKVPDLSGLGLEALGVEVAPRRPLLTDAHGRVEGHEHLWAAGDITGIAPFTHTANYHGRLLTANLLGCARQADYRAIPRGVYTDPSIASVGLSEVKARAQGIDVVAATHSLGDTARAFATGRGHGLVKLVADRERRIIVGAAAAGLHVEDLIGEMTLAIKAEVPLGVLADLVHPFPTYSEAWEPPVRELAERLGGSC